jgi:hypothetical protein
MTALVCRLGVEQQQQKRPAESTNTVDKSRKKMKQEPAKKPK